MGYAEKKLSFDRGQSSVFQSLYYKVKVCNMKPATGCKAWLLRWPKGKTPKLLLELFVFLNLAIILPYNLNLQKSQYKLKGTVLFLPFRQSRILMIWKSATSNFSAIGYVPGRHPWQPQTTCLCSSWRQLLALLFVSFPLKGRVMRNYCQCV